MIKPGHFDLYLVFFLVFCLVLLCCVVLCCVVLERERESVREQGKGAEGERKRESQTGSMPSTEADAGLHPMTLGS